MKKITTFADLKDIKGRNFNRMIYNQLTHLNKKFFVSLGLVLVFFASCLPSTSAQTIVNSPLSYIGMGELYTPETPSNSMMGGIGVSNSNGIYSNQINPALLVRNQYTMFEVGINAELKNMQDYRQRQQALGGNYQSVNLTVPVLPNRWTMSFGVRPYSTVNYETRSYRRLNVLGVDSLLYSYKGEGGVSKLSIANGVRIGKELYVGLEMGFLFGAVNRNVGTQNLSDGQFYKIQLENQSRYSDFTFKAGAAWRKVLKGDVVLNAGATLDLSPRLNSTLVKRFVTYDLGGLNIINSDTLSKSQSITQQLPVSTRLGVSVERLAHWMVGVDYVRTDWSKVDNNLGRSAVLPVSQQVSIGAEYTPDFESISNFFKRVTYRVGVSQTTTPYDFAGNGQYAKDQSLSLGVALPLRNFLNYINVSYQIGKRGSLTDNRLEEQYHRVVVGLTLGDIWFRKVKID
ncbi:MAG: hypothetical protein KA527_01680 [Cytophagaceae bacterium]|nr:hypothetical protein [Cytophagaceae bacterium]MBP6092767.1 hypothetical protein [Cytophagaceae bacterium]